MICQHVSGMVNKMNGIYRSKYKSPVGVLTLGSDGENITGLWIEGQKYFGSTLCENASETPLTVFELAAKWLDIYFAGTEPDFMPPLKPFGSNFRRGVWQLLREIPYGSLTTYGQLAADLEARTGRRTCARAVGSAVGKNPISIFIPCHRVVGTDGSLTGYAGGVERKRLLLQLEGIK